MRKFFTLLFILATSLLCTACINNLAVQELNQIGKEYLEKGEYDAAIARFQSSIDLDENLFESRYNLGVAYINKKDYEKAIKELKTAVSLSPESPDAYYSYAVALEGEGLKIEDEGIEEINADENTDSESLSGADNEVTKSVNLLSSAIQNYEKYISMIDKEQEKEQIKSHIEELVEAIARISGANPTVSIPPDGDKEQG